jgi:hypothetical protein
LAASLSVFAAPKDDVIQAATKLADEANYSWKSTVTVPEGSQFRPGPSEGQTEKDGYTYLKSSFGDNTTETVMKGDKVAFTNQDGDWESASEASQDQGRGRFRAMMARNFKAPAAQALELAKGAKDLKQTDDTYSGTLTDEAAKAMLRFGRGRGGGGGEGPTVSDASGSVKFWLKDGALVKYEYKVKGTISFNGNDREIDRTTTTEIKDVGTTKVKVPDQAKKKLS